MNIKHCGCVSVEIPVDTFMLTSASDTGLSEVLMPITRSEEFTKMLEIQQSRSSCIYAHFSSLTSAQSVDIVAGYDLSSQLEAIENLMNQEVPAMLVLRAAVLLHLTQGGIRQKMLENFKREFLQVSSYFRKASLRSFFLDRLMDTTICRF